LGLILEKALPAKPQQANVRHPRFFDSFAGFASFRAGRSGTGEGRSQISRPMEAAPGRVGPNAVAAWNKVHPAGPVATVQGPQ
jgi:hypothetical protein